MGYARNGRIAAGALALGAVSVLIAGAFAGLLAEGLRDASGAIAAFDTYLFRVVRFTLLQAALSTALSILPAILVARALSRLQDFPGRRLVLRLFAIPLAIPAIVAALGVLSLYGRAGYLSQLVTTVSGDPWEGIYGLRGILVAHVFFNLPLATRFFLEALQTVPRDQWRLASQLGMGSGSAFRFIEWPAIRSSLPGVAGLVFMLCITSFTIVLTLGGGPRATTLEVAIYQALRFDFDPARAVSLTLLQILLTVAVMTVLFRFGADLAGDPALAVAARRHTEMSRRERLVDGLTIAAALVFVAGPLAAIVSAGLNADLVRLAGEEGVRRAAATSLVLASFAAVLSTLAAFALAGARRALAADPGRMQLLLGGFADTGAGFVLVVPPIVIGAGWFVLLRHHADVFAIAPAMVVSVNAVMAMPFALRAIRPAHDAAAERHDRLCAQLGIRGWTRIRLVDWPTLRRPFLTALAFSMALSLGDLGVIALFGSDSVQTLPFLLLQRLGSYRTDDAAGLALFLGLLCFGLMAACDHFGRETR